MSAAKVFVFATADTTGTTCDQNGFICEIHGGEYNVIEGISVMPAIRQQCL